MIYLFTGVPRRRRLEVNLMYLGEHSIDCKLTFDRRTIYLKNMSNYQTRLGMPSLASEVFFLEVSQKVDESSDTSTSFAQKFNDQDTSDFTVKCQDKSFYVHQMILKERSEYFSMILRNDCIENQKKELILDDSDPKIVESMLRYIYNNTVPVSNSNRVMDLLQIADKYQFTELFDACDSYLAQICTHKLSKRPYIPRTALRPYIKRAVEGANMVRAPKWTAAIFQKRIEDANLPVRYNAHVAQSDDLEETWTSLIAQNTDFASMAAKTTRRDFTAWLEQHKAWTFVPFVKNKEKTNDLVFIVGPQGEMKGAIQCAKV